MTGYNGPFRADDEEARQWMSTLYPREVPAEPAGQETVMGPGREVNRGAAGTGAALAAEEAALMAAQDAFAGKWDIIEVFGGYMAVPPGAEVVRASTVGGLTAKLRRMEHDAVPRPDTAYTMEGARTGRLLDLRYGNCWPAEGICAGCGMVLRREAVTEPWEHTGRKPGEAG